MPGSNLPFVIHDNLPPNPEDWTPEDIMALAPPLLPPEDKMLLQAPGYRFQALWINLPPWVDTLTVWHRYHGRADIENRIRKLGQPFGDQGFDRSKYINYACSIDSFRLSKSENSLPGIQQVVPL